MPAPKSDQIRDQVLTLAKEGHSPRTIEGILAKRGVRIGKSAIHELVRLYRAGAIPDPIARGSSTSSSGTSTPSAPTLPSDATGTALDVGAVADLDLEQLVALASLFETRLRSALDVGDVRLAGWLLNARRTVAQEVARLRPPVLPDPARDPANVSAREELRARLLSAVASYERSDAGRAQLRSHLARLDEAEEGTPLADAAE